MTVQTLHVERFIWHNLLNCYLRELQPPTRQVGRDLHIELPRTHQLLKVALQSADPLQFGEQIWLKVHHQWHPTRWQEVGEVLARELTAQTGEENPEFLHQLEESARFTLRFLQDASPAPQDSYLHSEQSLTLGHRFHPTPKSRSGSLSSWEKYSPELKTRFVLRYFAVQEAYFETNAPDLTRFEHENIKAPEGYRLLPAHPWQARLALAQPAIKQALEKGILLDLGEGSVHYAPTSSIRTLYREGHPWFYKFSLHARITNCLRKNAHYELTGAALLTEHMRPVLQDLAQVFPETRVLLEPAYCTVKLDTHSKEYLGMLLRENPAPDLRDGEALVLCATLTDEAAQHPAHLSRVSSKDLLPWWKAYLRQTVAPVLHLFFQHGVVLEPHLQNVLIVLRDGLPAQAIFRDLEGTKVLPEHHSDLLQNAPQEVRKAITYDRDQGWKRVAYCLLVNHLLEVGKGILIQNPQLKQDAWQALADEVEAHQQKFGAEPELQDLLSGSPLPGKANLLNRWQRQADREAGYVPVANPLKELR
ncbi:IucA/IucC family protein [Deinococcus cellulosilyticus]|uniref:Aconitase n=1 Tax=Deinococcus cellulosilyticus (strain DSM 18568 / NBRC 106333 / KACC 11606 / 5516J-15) TaxID=1223518 RepID=A0A511MVS1_DEIC1|nr:IucA/IucC family protein [Deinococcus cellulosilyticus]GEM44672.1 aconitase [Deinococcus cellulosilyticus NBRC 106333 = KACC 11606]